MTTTVRGPAPRRPGRGAAASLGAALWVAAVAIGTSAFVAAATAGGWLLPAALPLGVALVAAMAWLPPRAQHIGWAVLSVALLATVYLGHGDREHAALGVVVLLALAGTFASPWFLVALWFVHPVWDLLPRDLPAAQHDLPHACLVYDLVVGAYLALRVRRGDFVPFGARPGRARGRAATTRRGPSAG